jgi:hypothetical protein
VLEFEPRVRGGPPTFLGSGAVALGLESGAEERVRPGCAKASEEDSFPQQLPMVDCMGKVGMA